MAAAAGSNSISLATKIMEFDGVYRTLLELFPQVDSRLLKAVAIEHPKHVESAVEVLISEVLPYFPQKSETDSPPQKDSSSGSISSGRAVDEEEVNSSPHHQAGLENIVSTSVESRSTANDDADKTANAVFDSDSTDQEKMLSLTSVSSSGIAVDSNQLQRGNSESDELILLVRSPNQEDSSKAVRSQNLEVVSSVLPCEEIAGFERIETNVPAKFGECQDINSRVEHDRTSQFIPTNLEPQRGNSDGSLTSGYTEVKEFDGSSSDELDEFLGERSPQTELSSDGMNSQDAVFEEAPSVVECDLEEEFSCSSKFGPAIKVDILEDIIEAAKHHKTTLFLEVESIMNKMREVELQETIAEQTKDEAASAGLETLGKVEQLKQMLAHAKEANDMHTGEVYGEKSILATEVKELQGRLLSLSDERDKALSILNEMDQTLEARLAVADELKKAAEKQKLEKEESARSALAEQEAIMEKVVQESKILQQEAEENSKLREFLVDRGHVVDTLQGEISVICHDVRLLKEKFDERVPLSKSISSNQTSCILASSGSSAKSMASDPIFQHRETFMSPTKNRSPASSVDGRSPASSVKGKSSSSEEKDTKINFDEDDWEFFE
ncbi:hypothetical protein M5689_003646 [Euphorbia peplus]|nr:hypothetical protein M5689_003646 [Euphorbia peplus]